MSSLLPMKNGSCILHHRMALVHQRPRSRDERIMSGRQGPQNGCVHVLVGPAMHSLRNQWRTLTTATVAKQPGADRLLQGFFVVAKGVLCTGNQDDRDLLGGGAFRRS